MKSKGIFVCCNRAVVDINKSSKLKERKKSRCGGWYTFVPAWVTQLLLKQVGEEIKWEGREGKEKAYKVEPGVKGGLDTGDRVEIKQTRASVHVRIPLILRTTL